MTVRSCPSETHQCVHRQGRPSSSRQILSQQQAHDLPQSELSPHPHTPKNLLISPQWLEYNVKVLNTLPPVGDSPANLGP